MDHTPVFGEAQGRLKGQQFGTSKWGTPKNEDPGQYAPIMLLPYYWGSQLWGSQSTPFVGMIAAILLGHIGGLGYEGEDDGEGAAFPRNL